jgi:hypothetical protein
LRRTFTACRRSVRLWDWPLDVDGPLDVDRVVDRAVDRTGFRALAGAL